MKRYISTLLFFALLTTSCSRINSVLNKSSPTPAAPTATTAPTATQPPLPSETPTPTPVVVQGTLSIWHSWNEAEMPALVQIVHDFQRLYPNVLFDIWYVPLEDLRSRYEIEVRDGRGPTLLLGPAEWGPLLYDAGLLADLSEQTSESLRSALNSPALGAARYHNAQIGLPYAIKGVVLYRNKDIMTINADTFDELATLAQAATQGEAVGAVLERSFLYSGAHLAGMGGQWMDEDSLPAFNNATGLAWLQLLRDLEQAGPPNYLSDQDLDAFKAGRVGWLIDGTWNLSALAEAIGPEKLAVDPWPVYQDSHLSGFVFSENVYLNPRIQNDNQLAAWKFIEYLVSPEAQARLAEVGRIPAAAGVQTTDQINGPLVAQAMTALAGGTAYPISPYLDLYTVQMEIAIQAYLGGMPPAEALQAAYTAIQDGITASQPTPAP